MPPAGRGIAQDMAASGPLAHEASAYSNGNYSVRKPQFSFKEE